MWKWSRFYSTYATPHTLHILICVLLFCLLTSISVFRILLLTICSGSLTPCDLHHQQVKVLNFKILCNKAEYITGLMYVFYSALCDSQRARDQVKEWEGQAEREISCVMQTRCSCVDGKVHWKCRIVIRKGGKNLTPLQCFMLSTLLILHPSGSTAPHGYKRRAGGSCSHEGAGDAYANSLWNERCWRVILKGV